MKRACPIRQSGRKGAELVEFALVLPLLLLLFAGIFDFGSLFALRQKMTNAAREGARIVVSTPLSDMSCSSATPCSIVAAANAVVQYMTGAGASISCIQPASPTTSAGLKWTYSCTNGTSLVINRGYSFSMSGSVLVPATQVTLVYPIQWWLMQFLPGFSRFRTITTQTTMQNLVSD
ncbi:MAG TPA: TadE/TadG family type IV pilus assembly protein [Candidatus Dormibacteraeota bacterium]|nr:TadE/TadG family type IV pilus assembly protein [Candidatus Dormibacteraeota bacterium]